MSILTKKKLYMIGNSHIDPVWFWDWEEGMQEVKSTFASALSRMREFDDYRFTCTSTAFLKWIEDLLPDMFEEIRERVREGRFELTGGWFIEPDCILPSGEAFVRQGLYGQRYLKDRFGSICKIGSNVDSFGHNANLPQILKKSGMDSYVFMRPRLNTPLFRWESADGSSVNAICLPAEYTTWFKEPTIKNINNTIERTKEYEKMVCCYGVGNHGGGPTIENIQTILDLQEYGSKKNDVQDCNTQESNEKESKAQENAISGVNLQGKWEGVEFVFSTFTEFLQETQEEKLSSISGPFENINQGCYSIDSEFKRLNRLAERRLVEADTLISMAADHTGSWMEEEKEIERLWEILHFNEFHDTMGGTAIKSARDEAIMQLGGVCAKAGFLKAKAIQRIANSLDTRQEGFPLIVFHTGGQPYEDYVEAELEWFCQSPLKLLNPEGIEIPYQRVHTAAKVRHTTLGGRRRIVFRAKIPACGYAVYRVFKEEPTLCSTPHMELLKPAPYLLENAYLRVEFDSVTGMIKTLIEKETGYNALSAPASIRLYTDQRDAWGGLQGKKYEDRNVSFQLKSIQKVESGDLRETVRVQTAWEGTTLEQLFTLGAEERELRVENRLHFAHEWALLKLAYPTGESHSLTRAETAYGIVTRDHKAERKPWLPVNPQTVRKPGDWDCDEYNMQRFLDITGEDQAGLAIANDSKYAFHMDGNGVQITIARSAIYAQGNSKDWENNIESYEYTDQGVQTFCLVLRPHGSTLPEQELYRIAGKINGAYDYLADSNHAPSAFWSSDCSKKSQTPAPATYSMAAVDHSNVEVMVVKKACDDDSYIVRLLEVSGEDTNCCLTFRGVSYPLFIGHHEIKTVKITAGKETAQEVNLLEWED